MPRGVFWALFGCLMVSALLSWWLSPVTVGAARPPTQLTFDEVPTQPVNGLTVDGVTFGYTIGGQPSTEATYNVGPYVNTVLVQGSALRILSDGVLTLDFERPTRQLRFDVARGSFSTIAPSVRVELFDRTGAAIGTFLIDTSPLGPIDPQTGVPTFSEGQFSYSDNARRVKRAVVTQLQPEFGLALDNLVFIP